MFLLVSIATSSRCLVFYPWAAAWAGVYTAGAEGSAGPREPFAEQGLERCTLRHVTCQIPRDFMVLLLITPVAGYAFAVVRELVLPSLDSLSYSHYT